ASGLASPAAPSSLGLLVASGPPPMRMALALGVPEMKRARATPCAMPCAVQLQFGENFGGNRVCFQQDKTPSMAASFKVMDHLAWSTTTRPSGSKQPSMRQTVQM
ncbi:hypothetical protein, partial [Bradyrhizobium sp. AS23.2]|uniref:hypothetical protein n=1 Tax=Bradyrhizobium sp. AS23.2 TaxID=1680155 RepID=UPI001AD7FCD4